MRPNLAKGRVSRFCIFHRFLKNGWTYFKNLKLSLYNLVRTRVDILYVYELFYMYKKCKKCVEKKSYPIRINVPTFYILSENSQRLDLQNYNFKVSFKIVKKLQICLKIIFDIFVFFFVMIILIFFQNFLKT